MNILRPGRKRDCIKNWAGFFIFWYVFVSSPIADCDYINLSGAKNAPNIIKIHINENHVKISFEIYIHDIPIFDHLLPDDFFKERNLKVPHLKKRLEMFSKTKFQVITDTGIKLVPELVTGEFRIRADHVLPDTTKMDAMTKKSLPGSPNHNQLYFAELVYPFNGKPETLTFVPPMDERTGRIAATIGFVTFHKQAIISNFHYLYRAATIRLDWEDPWYSQYKKKAFKREITSGAKTFIYIEPFEVRHEILIRVKDLKTWIDLEFEGKNYLEAHENKILKNRVGQFFLDQEALLVDGKKLRPILDRTAFAQYTMNGLNFIEAPERLPISSAWVGVIITYLTDGIPQKVEAPWNLWSKRIVKVPTNTVDPEGSFPSYVTSDMNVQVWENKLKTFKSPTIENVMVSDRRQTFNFSVASSTCLILILPFIWIAIRQRKKGRQILVCFALIFVLSIGSVVLLPYTAVSIPRPGIDLPGMTQKETGQVLYNLLKNIYRSFEFREEEDVYDKLSICVDGDILTKIYLQNRKSFEIKQAGGAQAKVKTVEILGVEIIPRSRYFERHLQVRAVWSASGSVGHWGHLHIRKNQYKALVTLKPIGGVWKIIDLDLVEEKRVDPYAVK